MSEVTHDITERLPLTVSARAVAAAYASSGSGTPDVLVGGMPFRFRLSDQEPYIRQTADFRRQQIDTSPEPGEQTLSTWWTRDQDSWHRGSGITYYEPGSVPSTRYRYARSIGIDPWTRGEIKLQRAMSNAVPVEGDQSVYVAGAVLNGSDVLLVNHNGNVTMVDSIGGLTDMTSTSAALFEPCVAGNKVLVGSAAGILVGTLGGTALTTLWSTSSNRSPRVWWVKSRIISAMGPDLYDLTLAGGAISSATPMWTHPSPSWTWTGVAETPTAILAAGHEAGRGAVFKFVLEQPSSGTIPVLSAGIPVAELPSGEEVHALRTLMGTIVSIGTSRGVRVGEVANSGDIQFGPLTVESTEPVRCLAYRDHYLYAGITSDLDGVSGCARIDLAEEIDEQAPTVQGTSQAGVSYRRSLRFAWAYDASAGTIGQVDSIAMFGATDRVCLGVFGHGAYVQSTDTYVSGGYLTSGKIRFGTSENKRFLYCRVHAQITPGGSVAVNTIDVSGADQFCFSLGDAYNANDDVALATIDANPQANASFRLSITRGSTATQTPVLESFQVKALPVVRIQRDIRYALALYDRETDRRGVPCGYDGAAWQRLQVLENIESTQSVVSVEDKTNGERFTGIITQVQFVRDTNPDRANSNFGGLLQLTLRKL